jgi:demethylmenaquinone methyltransferase/2-methoxy-6-polyprenyl-1,4-benzoquinol methylase
VSLLRADALALPFADRSFDVVSCAFGLRNLPDRARGIAEMSRVLRPGGRLLILEFAPPRRGLAGDAFRRYLSSLIPLVGGVLSGERRAYRYLRDSIVAFLEPAEVAGLMLEAGLEHVRVLPLTAGIAFVYRGTVPPASKVFRASQPP